MMHLTLYKAIPTTGFFLRSHGVDGSDGAIVAFCVIVVIALALALFSLPVVYFERDDKDFMRFASNAYAAIGLANCLLGGGGLVLLLGFAAVTYLSSGVFALLPFAVLAAVMVVGGTILLCVAWKIEPPRPQRLGAAPRDAGVAEPALPGSERQEPWAAGGSAHAGNRGEGVEAVVPSEPHAGRGIR